MVESLLRYMLGFFIGLTVGLLVGYAAGALIGIFHWYRRSARAHQELSILAALDFEPEDADD